jgi:hypothetical protein
MDSLCVIFAPALEKYSTNLLTRISLDYNLPLDELVTKYMSRPEAIKAKKAKDPNAPKKPRAPKDPNAPKKPPKIPAADRPICPSLTGKKTPCKNRCLPGSDKCHLHSVTLPGGDPKPPKVPKEKKVKVKDQPTHNHAPLIAPEAPCQLCDTHGDALNPGLPTVSYESETLQERLARIMAMEDEPEEPEEDESEPESPGAIRHREILASQGLVPSYDEEEEDEMTEDEFEEEELEE